MALFVYVTDACKQEAQAQNCLQDVLKFQQRIQEDQRTTLFDNFPPPYLKKRFKRQQRLIAGEIKVEEHVVICFYRLLIRGGNEYASFLANPKQYGDRHFFSSINEAFLARWLAEQLKSDPPPEKQEPTQHESEFLWAVYAEEDVTANETFIFESADWIQGLRKDNKIMNRLIQLPEILFDVGEGKYGSDFQVISKSSLNLIFRYFPKFQKVFLAGIVPAGNDTEIESTIRKYVDVLKKPSESVSNEDIIKASSRSYPAIVLVDADRWIEIEKNEEANLALSPEESELLTSAHRQSQKEGETSGFPLFINGRAGSGKSTILQYLFTDYLRCYLGLTDPQIHPPLYLTYSETLLTRSKIVGVNLLNSGYKSVESNKTINSEQVELLCNKAFQVFKKFLLSSVPIAERQARFPEPAYVDFRKFKDIWRQKFRNDPKAHRYGPDISWHVIRSFIKGLSLGGYLDPEEYSELADNEKNVMQVTYQMVYEKVWVNWYQPLCEGNGLQIVAWDDQDLVRYLLDNDYISPEIPAIFCDEAQDFTRIELELILRLSIFSDRKINSQHLNRVPFAFAGDPFQTLNPTGFRWEAIKVAFVSKFIHSLDPAQKFGKNELNYKELSYNYRSSEHIVKLCNTIQTLRISLFGHMDLTPQEAWTLEESSFMPVWFEKEDPSVADQLGKKLELWIIVPCEEGEEKEYVQKDDLLAEVIPIDEAGVPRNVLSPSRAKGLEFDQVVLYGFGDYALAHFQNSFSEMLREGNQAGDESLVLEYFVNQLYVAASRPRKRLFVIDSKRGLDHLWEFAIGTQYQEEILENERTAETWKDHMGGIQKGLANSWTEDKEDSQEVGEKLEAEGIAKNDPFLLRQAAFAYSNAKNKRKAHYCRARALLIERKFLEAGEQYILAGDQEQALEAYWSGGCYGQICDLSVTNPGFQTRLETRIANLIESDISSAQVFSLMQELALKMKEESFKRVIYAHVSWEGALSRVLMKINQLPSDEDTTTWQIIFSLVEEVGREGLRIAPERKAAMAFRAGAYESAVNYWTISGETAGKDYKYARLQLILKKPGHERHPEETLFMAQYFESQKNYLEASKYFKELANVSAIERILEEVLKRKQEDEVEKIIVDLIAALSTSASWDKAIELIKLGRLPISGKDGLLSKMKYSTLKWQAILTRNLAKSQELANSDNRTKMAISDHLKNEYLEQKMVRWQHYIHPLVVGAAFERAGKDIDCLKFYEEIENSPELTDDIKKKAAYRWIHVKYQQAERENETPKLRDIAKKHQKEADSKVKGLGIPKPFDEPRFPDIDTYLEYQGPREIISSDNQRDSDRGQERFSSRVPPDNTAIRTVNFGNILSRISPQFGRINLEHTQTMQTAVIRFEECDGKSDDVHVESINKRIRIEAWNLEIDLSELDIQLIRFKDMLTGNVEIIRLKRS